MALLDYGCVKAILGDMAADMKGYVGAAVRAAPTQREEDWAAFSRAVSSAMDLEGADAELQAFTISLMRYVLSPLVQDAPFEFTRAFTAGVNDMVIEMKRDLIFRGSRPRVPKIPPVPGGYTFINRLQWGFFSVLTRLRATVNWHRMLPADLREGT